MFDNNWLSQMIQEAEQDAATLEAYTMLLTALLWKRESFSRDTALTLKRETWERVAASAHAANRHYIRISQHNGVMYFWLQTDDEAMLEQVNNENRN